MSSLQNQILFIALMTIGSAVIKPMYNNLLGGKEPKCIIDQQEQL